MRTQNKLKKHLQSIIADAPHSLKAAVAQEALDHEDIQNFFADLLQHGCQSGMVSSLIYYYDTRKFYDTHYAEIEELREELEDSFGEALRIKGDLKNWFAWLGFEETARSIADSLHIPY